MGIEYIFSRKIKKVKTKLKEGDEASVESVDDDNSFTTTSGFVNFMYRWNSFYIPFGFSYTNISFKEGDSEGGFGANVGLGWQLSSFTYLELMIKNSSFDSDDEVDGVTMGQATLTSIGAQFKFHFF